MADKDPDSDESLFSVDTVPPPPGHADAYDAPTRVGPASSDEWAALIRQADAEGKRSAQALQQAPLSARPKPKREAKADSSSTPDSTRQEPQARAVAVVHDADEADDVPTRLHSAAPSPVESASGVERPAPSSEVVQSRVPQLPVVAQPPPPAASSGLPAHGRALSPFLVGLIVVLFAIGIAGVLLWLNR